MSLAYVHNDDDFIPVVRSRTVPVAILDDGQPVAFRPVPSPALVLQQRDTQALMLVLPSDHLIPDTQGFRATVGAARQSAQDGALVLPA